MEKFFDRLGEIFAAIAILAILVVGCIVIASHTQNNKTENIAYIHGNSP